MPKKIIRTCFKIGLEGSILERRAQAAETFRGQLIPAAEEQSNGLGGTPKSERPFEDRTLERRF